ELKKELVAELLRRNVFVVSPALVERHLDGMVQSARVELMLSGIDARNLSEEAIARLRDELREKANDEVRGLLLLDAIATQEKVEVTDADLEKYLAEQAQKQNKSVPRLKAELQKEERLDIVRFELRKEKTLDLLLSRAKIKR